MMSLTTRALQKLLTTPAYEWPEGTAEALLATLRDPQVPEDERALAADLAGDPVVINDELAGALLEILRSGEQPERVRGAAALALGPALELCDLDGFEDVDQPPVSESTFARVQGELRALYHDASVPKDVRRQVLETAVRAPADWQRDALRAAAASSDADWRLTAVFGMRYVDGFEEAILAALESPDPRIHREAVLAAGAWELAEAGPHVLELVRSPECEKDLLLAAIEAVGSICPDEGAEDLEELAEDEDEDVADAAAEALATADHAFLGDDEGEDDEDEEGDEEEGEDEEPEGDEPPDRP